MDGEQISSSIDVKSVLSPNGNVKKVVIGVRPIFSKKIAVERHNGYYYVLCVLAVLFTACWLMAFCDLVGII